MENKTLPFRQIHLDFHTSPYIEGIGEKFDSKKFVDTLKRAHVNSINLFVKCHHGMYYYPTKIGTMHPNLKFDLFGEQLKACKENGIRALAYTCVSWNEDWADRHPEWLTINAEGVWGTKKPFESSYYSWRSICYNNGDYQDVLKKEFKEVYELYHPDGFWIDIVQGKNCICKTCSEDMRKINLNPEHKEDVEKFDRIGETYFCRTMYEYIKSMDENLEIYFNSHPYVLDDGEDKEASSVEKRKYFDFIDIESLPSDQWGYTHFPVAVNYLNKYDQEVCMMNGKFHTAWGDFGSIRHKNALEYEVLRAVANGARVCIGDQLHPVGELDQPVYERIGEVYDEIERLEPWLYDTKKVSEIAVLIPAKAGQVDLQHGGKSEEGVYRILSELHYLFDFINVEDSLEQYQLLILPDHVDLSDRMASKINQYVAQGGKVLMSGISGLRNGKSQIDTIDLKHHGKSIYDVQYIHLDKNYFAEIPSIDHILYESGESVTGTGDVFAQIVNPYFARTYQKFCSHRQTPPRKETGDEVAVLRGTGGFYINFPIFRLYTDYGYTIYRDIMQKVLYELVATPSLKTDLPAITELTLRKKESSYVLHMLNYVIARKAKTLDTIEEKFTVCSKSVNVKTEKCPRQVMLIPEEKEIPFVFEDEYTRINIEQAQGYTGYFIEI